MKSNQIINQLLTSINKSLVTDLLDEYATVKKKQVIGEWDDCLVHCGKFAELTLAIVKIIYGEKIDKNTIYFDALYRELTTKPKCSADDDILLLAIPNAAKTIYTIRNKKKAAHIKAINPDFIDGTISSAICNWILSQFVLIKCKSNPKEVAKFIDSLIERTIPLIEEFEDDSLLVLNKNINFKDKLLLVLNYLNKRTTNDEIKHKINVKYPKKLTTALSNLENNLLIHKNSSGVQITKLGIQAAEEIIKKYNIF